MVNSALLVARRGHPTQPRGGGGWVEWGRSGCCWSCGVGVRRSHGEVDCWRGGVVRALLFARRGHPTQPRGRRLGGEGEGGQRVVVRAARAPDATTGGGGLVEKWMAVKHCRSRGADTRHSRGGSRLAEKGMTDSVVLVARRGTRRGHGGDRWAERGWW